VFFEIKQNSYYNSAIVGDEERVKGIKDEKWSGWLLPGGEEEYKNISSPEMAGVVRSLARRSDAVTPIDKLVEYYDDLEKLLDDGKATDEEVAPYLARIAERAERLSENKSKTVDVEKRTHEDEPKTISEDELYHTLDTILDGIESSNLDTHDLAITYQVKDLKAQLDTFPEKIRREVEVRLALHDASELVKQAGGWILRPTDKVGYGLSIGGAFTEADRRQHQIDRKVVKTMLSPNEDERLIGLKTNTAWDVLQVAVFNYNTLIKQVNKDRTEKFTLDDTEIADNERVLGQIPTNYWIDSNEERKKAVNNYMVKLIASSSQSNELDFSKITPDKLGEKLNSFKMLDEAKNSEEFVTAKKALQLTEKLAIATLETSVFNQTAMTGNDEFAEIIGLKGWRVRRGRTGRDRGPDVHVNVIDGFGTSWLRRLHINQMERTETEANKNKVISEKEPFFSSSLDLKDVPRGDWLFYGTTEISRLHSLKNLLLDRTPSAAGDGGGFKYDIVFLQSAVVFFNTADKPARKDDKIGPKCLKHYWALGVLDMALRNPQLGWGQDAFYNYYKALIHEQLSPEAGSFLSEKQWKVMTEDIKFEKRMKELGFWNYFDTKSSDLRKGNI